METMKNASCKECLNFDTYVCTATACAKCLVLNIAPSECNNIEECREDQMLFYKNCRKFEQKIGDWDK